MRLYTPSPGTRRREKQTSAIENYLLMLKNEVPTSTSRIKRGHPEPRRRTAVTKGATAVPLLENGKQSQYITRLF